MQTQDVSRYIDGRLRVVTRAAALTHRLLAFSRRQTLDPKPTDANGLIVSIENLLRHTLAPGIHLNTTFGSGLLQALCDPSQLENAVLNLAINRRDAMSAGGHLTIETSNIALDDG